MVVKMGEAGGQDADEMGVDGGECGGDAVVGRLTLTSTSMLLS